MVKQAANCEMHSITSSRVVPVETRPGKSGTYTLNVPSSSASRVTVYCFIGSGRLRPKNQRNIDGAEVGIQRE
jgi:hypothetical protein